MHTHICIHKYIRTHTHLYVCAYDNVYVYVYVYLYACVAACVCKYMYMYMYLHVHLQMHMYMYMWKPCLIPICFRGILAVYASIAMLGVRDPNIGISGHAYSREAILGSLG